MEVGYDYDKRQEGPWRLQTNKWIFSSSDIEVEADFHEMVPKEKENGQDQEENSPEWYGYQDKVKESAVSFLMAWNIFVEYILSFP